MLAGGQGSRLGGREKGEIRVDGRRLVDIVVSAALESGCEMAIIAGQITADRAITVREHPPFGGPVAGLAAAMPEVKTDWIMLLGCDLPHAGLLCRLLAESFRDVAPETDGLVALTDGRVQWLAGFYRRTSIERSLTNLDAVDGTSLRDLFGGMVLREVRDPEGLAREVDTPEDLERLTQAEEKQ